MCVRLFVCVCVRVCFCAYVYMGVYLLLDMRVSVVVYEYICK